MKVRGFLEVAAVFGTLTVLPGIASAAYKFKVSTEGSDTHQTTVWAKAFSEAVAKSSNGQVTADVFTNGQLGKNKELPSAITVPYAVCKITYACGGKRSSR